LAFLQAASDSCSEAAVTPAMRSRISGASEISSRILREHFYTCVVITEHEMDAMKIFKTFLKIVAWIIGGVVVPVLTALGLSAVFQWEFKVIIIYFAAFYILCFFLAFAIHFIKDYIKKQIYAVLKEAGVKTKEKHDEEKNDD
jgi:hypothetical protein